MTTINIKMDRKEVEQLLESKGIEYTKQTYGVEVWHDQCAGNPWEEWDGQIPLMCKFDRSITDYSKGDIKEYIGDSVTDAQLLEHADLFLYWQGNWSADDLKDMELDEQLDILRDGVTELLDGGGLGDIGSLCNLIGINYYHGSVKGYSQGDYAEVLLVPTFTWEQETGAKIEEVTEEGFEEARKLFEYWAFGDVYGFSVVDNYGEVLDSCGGFYGPLWNSDSADQMVEHIDLEAYGWTREEAIELLKDAEVKYG